MAIRQSDRGERSWQPNDLRLRQREPAGNHSVLGRYALDLHLCRRRIETDCPGAERDKDNLRLGWKRLPSGAHLMPVTNYTCINGEVLSENSNGTKRDYVPDPLGSTVALLDNTQTKTDAFEYWPYGEVRTRTGTTATPFQYVGTLGYYRDSASREYVRARTLRTDQGRWLTEDPIGPYHRDRYGYASQGPVTDVDPSGYFPCLRGGY